MAVDKSQSLNAAAVWIAGPGGEPLYPVQATGPQPAANSQSVTQATGSRFDTVSRGADNLVTSQAAVTTTATQAVAARAGRTAVILTNSGAIDVLYGPAGLTDGNGALLTGAKGAAVTLSTSAAVFVKVPATPGGTTGIYITEIF